MHLKRRKVVVALGGHAISRPGVTDTIANQFKHTRESLPPIIDMAREGFRIVITHGNGPQVGNALLRAEIAKGVVPDLPLGILDADTEGGMGYMIEQSLQNGLHLQGIDRKVATIVTQILVDRDDPSIKDPSKFVGRFYTKEEAKNLARENGWTVKEDHGRGWRRVVPSPVPLEIVNHEVVKMLMDAGIIVIAAGGGGIPVYREPDGRLEGMDAVIDKDRASAILGLEIGADTLQIMTEIDGVYLNYGSKEQKKVSSLSLDEAKAYLREGQFPAGSMGPKIESAIRFIEGGGKRVVISSVQEGYLALKKRAGTNIT